MPARWIVMIHRALDEPQPEQARVKIQRPAHVAGERGDVVEANRLGHEPDMAQLEAAGKP